MSQPQKHREFSKIPDICSRVSLDQGLDHGLVVGQVEEGVNYAVACRWEESSQSEIAKGIARPLAFVLNEEKTLGLWTGYYPFTLSIRNPANVLKFVEDQLAVLVIIDLEVVERIAGSLGYRFEYAVDDPIFRFSAIEPSIVPPLLCASRHFIGRVGFEFVSLRWLISEVLQPWDATVIAQFADLKPD